MGLSRFVRDPPTLKGHSRAKCLENLYRYTAQVIGTWKSVGISTIYCPSVYLYCTCKNFSGYVKIIENCGTVKFYFKYIHETIPKYTVNKFQ